MSEGALLMPLFLLGSYGKRLTGQSVKKQIVLHCGYRATFVPEARREHRRSEALG